jgi:hypothetical protein
MHCIGERCWRLLFESAKNRGDLEAYVALAQLHDGLNKFEGLRVKMGAQFYHIPVDKLEYSPDDEDDKPPRYKGSTTDQFAKHPPSYATIRPSRIIVLRYKQHSIARRQRKFEQRVHRAARLVDEWYYGRGHELTRVEDEWQGCVRRNDMKRS